LPIVITTGIFDPDGIPLSVKLPLVSVVAETIDGPVTRPVSLATVKCAVADPASEDGLGVEVTRPWKQAWILGLACAWSMAAVSSTDASSTTRTSKIPRRPLYPVR